MKWMVAEDDQELPFDVRSEGGADLPDADAEPAAIPGQAR
jgi:hypothetical protein